MPRGSTHPRISAPWASLGLRLVAERIRVRGRLPEPEALDAEEKRDNPGCRDRDIGRAGGDPGEFGDRVLPHGLHQQHAPLDHEEAHDPHADVAGELQPPAWGSW